MDTKAKPDGEGGAYPLELAALQDQITELREQFGALAKKLEQGGSLGARIATVERAFVIVSAILGELHTNAARSDISALVKELKALARSDAEVTRVAA